MDGVDRHELDLQDLRARGAEMNRLAAVCLGVRKVIADFDALSAARKCTVSPHALIDALREAMHA